jgi:hypothetical protein
MKKRFGILLVLALCALLPMQTFVGVSPVAAMQIAEDPTRNLSKKERKKIPFEDWVKSPTAKFLKKKESSNNCKARGYKGMYLGTWQMNAGFWKTYGGKKYGSNPTKATCREQDLVAYRGWLARGWSPWPPAKNFKP